MGKIKVLADENIGGEILEDIKKILSEIGVEVIPFPEEFKGKRLSDEELLGKLEEFGCKGIVSKDDGMVKNAIKKKLKVFLLIEYQHEKVYIVCEVKKIRGIRISKEYF
mgnify:CR=1 FL=1